MLDGDVDAVIRNVPMTYLSTGGRNCSMMIVDGSNAPDSDRNRARIATASTQLKNGL